MKRNKQQLKLDRTTIQLLSTKDAAMVQGGDRNTTSEIKTATCGICNSMFICW